jgi:hypothetical protein
MHLKAKTLFMGCMLPERSCGVVLSFFYRNLDDGGSLFIYFTKFICTISQ